MISFPLNSIHVCLLIQRNLQNIIMIKEAIIKAGLIIFYSHKRRLMFSRKSPLSSSSFCLPAKPVTSSLSFPVFYKRLWGRFLTELWWEWREEEEWSRQICTQGRSCGDCCHPSTTTHHGEALTAQETNLKLYFCVLKHRYFPHLCLCRCLGNLVSERLEWKSILRFKLRVLRSQICCRGEHSPSERCFEMTFIISNTSEVMFRIQNWAVSVYYLQILLSCKLLSPNVCWQQYKQKE